VIRGLDPDLPVDSIEPLTELVRTSLRDPQIEFGLIAAFALFALGLAAAGIYAVMGYATTQRLQEFGIRIALGATAIDIMRLVAGYGARLAAIGLAIGLTGAYLTGSLLTELLFGVRPADPAILAATVAVLGSVAMAACVAPARRALRADPMTALRAE
jgi:putative ABC transport system permease protein